MYIDELRNNKEYNHFIRFLKDEDAFLEFQQEYLRQHNFSMKNYVNHIKNAVKNFDTILVPTFIFDWCSSKNGSDFWHKLHNKYQNL